MAVKMSNKLVLLCSTAIGLIYSAGYVVTEETSTSTIVPTTPSYTISQNHLGNSQVQSQNMDQQIDSPHISHQKKLQKQNGKYRDGTFHGQGSNHIGSVEVAVSIKNSKITSVEIINCTTSYPQRDIEGLPKQVVQRQSANVDFVSGATRSSEDFQVAVQEALRQAKNA